MFSWHHLSAYITRLDVRRNDLQKYRDNFSLERKPFEVSGIDHVYLYVSMLLIDLEWHQVFCNSCSYATKDTSVCEVYNTDGESIARRTRSFFWLYN